MRGNYFSNTGFCSTNYKLAYAWLPYNKSQTLFQLLYQKQSKPSNSLVLIFLAQELLSELQGRGFSAHWNMQRKLWQGSNELRLSLQISFRQSHQEVTDEGTFVLLLQTGAIVAEFLVSRNSMAFPAAIFIVFFESAAKFLKLS